MNDYKNLPIWQAAHQLAIEVYQSSSRFPQHELYHLTSGLRRASLLIVSNIEEASSRTNHADKVRCLERSLQSAGELEQHLLLTGERSLLSRSDQEGHLKTVTKIKDMLSSHLNTIAEGRRDESGATLSK